MEMKRIPMCEKCGRILRLNTEKAEKVIASCECGFSKEVDEVSFSYKNNAEKVGEEGVLKEEEGGSFTHTCRKCGYNKCDVDELGAAYSDESNIYLYKCKKCGHVDRDAYGSSVK